MTEIQKNSLEPVLKLLLSCVRNMSLYPPEHPSVKEPLENTYVRMDELLRLHGAVPLGIVDEVLVFGGVPFYPNQIAVNELQKRIEAWNISTLEIEDGLTRREFSDFIGILARNPSDKEKDSHFSDVLREWKIEHIIAKDAKEVYNRALDAVSETLSEVRVGRIPKSSKAAAAARDLKRMVLSDRNAIMALTLIKSYDNYLFNHSVNVSVLSLALAQGLDVPEDDMYDIGLAGLLHDMGKTITPKSIILKPGDLNEEEWEEMKKHPEKSSEIVSQMEGVSPLVERLVREHHIHFDHKGYPEMEPGQSVHPYSQIISVADTYDAVTTLRPYQKPFQPREAMQILEDLSGSAIDPKYFEEFVKVLGIYPVGSLVRLDTNEVAVVLETYAESPMTPKVKVMFDPDGGPLSKGIEIDLSRPDSHPGEPRQIVSTIDPLLYNVEPSSLL